MWRGVQTGMRRGQSGFAFRVTPRQVIAVITVAALFGALVRQFGHGRGAHFTPTVTTQATTPGDISPTATTLPIVQLNWQESTTYPKHQYGSNLATTPGDGDTAYTCDQPQDASVVSVWATHDRGKTWRRVTDVPSVQYGICSVVVDDHDSAYVAVNILYGGHGHVAHSDFSAPSGAGGPSELMQYLSTNGGLSWRPLGNNAISESATVDGVMYALVSVGQTTPVLSVSYDNGQTWVFVGQALTRRYEFPAQMWIDPATHEWLVEGINPNQTKGDPTTIQELWRSTDQGKTWTSLPSPAFLFSGGQMMAALPPQNGRPWFICGDVYDGILMIQCSADDGHTWAQYPAPHKLPANAYPPLSVLGIATDGTIIAAGGYTVFRLKPGALDWQSLGATPTSAQVTFSPLPQGTIWQLQGQGPYVATLP